MKASLFPPLALAAVMSLTSAGPALADTFTTLDAEASSITFGYSQMNVKMDGSFSELKAREFSFDPAAPEAAKVVVDVALASIDAGYADANSELEKDEWLALKQHPLATFTSSSVQAQGEGQYQVKGQLSIKGNTHPVTVPFTFKQEGEKGIFEGDFTLQRADFGIGEGQWKDFSIVANEVQVRFRIVATP